MHSSVDRQFGSRPNSGGRNGGLAGGFGGPAQPRSKRVQVAAACRPCRDRKVKCDARRPCGTCQQRETTCHYETEAGETVSQAAKRKHAELSRSHDDLEKLFHLQSTRGEQIAANSLHLIRRGHSPRAVLGYMEANDRSSTPVPSRGSSATLSRLEKSRPDKDLRSDHDCRRLLEYLAKKPEYTSQDLYHRLRNGRTAAELLQQAELEALPQSPDETYRLRIHQASILAIAQSTAPLCDIVDFATSVIGPHNRVHLPAADIFGPLKQRLITLEMIAETLPLAPQSKIMDAHAGGRLLAHEELSDGSHDGPRFWVPGSPWSNLTSDDEAVSHLVSIYLTWMNPYWRWLEEDLFLRSIRAQPIRSAEYCSPLLMNAVLAIASQFSEIDEAFHTSGNLLTRGEHFHREALRLLSFEEHTPSITTIQALLVLQFDSSCRGKDRLAIELMAKAAALNRKLPLPRVIASGDLEAANLARARRCLDASVVLMALSLEIGCLRSIETAPVDSWTHLSVDDLPDRTIYWTGYPLEQQPKPLRANLMLQQRARLPYLIWKVMELLFSKAGDELEPSELQRSIDALSAEAEYWHNSLPTALQEKSDMPSPLFQFHSNYYCIMMTLYKYGIEKLGHLSRSRAEAATLNSVLARYDTMLQKQVFKQSKLVRWSRECYGYTIPNPYVYHGAAIGLGVLLPKLAEYPNNGIERQVSPDIQGGSSDIISAFEECFRCLLACGLQQMLPRGIARMVYHTARHLHVRLPANVSKMLDIAADAGWRTSDLFLMDSSYPNFATEQYTISEEKREHGPRMSDLLRKWESLS